MMATWSGDISGNVVWTNAEVQQIIGNVRVLSGATLTIQPGTVVKFNDFQGLSITVEGTLLAQGTAGERIIFTSRRDDTAGGDTNGDGNTSLPGAGYWNAIRFNPSSTGSVIDQAEIRFGGGSTGAVVVDGAALTLSNSKVQSSATSGVRIQNSNPTLTNLTFQTNTVAASMDLASNPAISGVTMTSNGVNALQLDAGTLAANGNWNDPDIAYLVNGTVTVPVDRSLSIAAGQVVKFREFGGLSLIVNGSLAASGNAASPVVFTSTRDDSVGGDAYNDGASPTGAGHWNSIRFNPGSTANSLDHVEVRYGGANAGAVVVDGAPLTLSSSKLQASSSNGIRIQNANPTLTGIVFQSNVVAASMDLASNPAISGVTMLSNSTNALVLDGGSLTANLNWNDPDITYLVNSTVTVPAGLSLTVGPRQVVKFREFGGISLIVDGSLAANGTSQAPVIFTTSRDDSAGGDTYNDGVTPVGLGQWNSIVLNAISTANVLDQVEVRYGGAVSGAVVVNGGPLAATNTKFQSSATSGIRIQNSNPTLTNVTYQNNAVAASMDLGSSPTIGGVTMTNNGVNALLLDGGTLATNGNWNDPDITYLLNGSVTIPADKTLSIAAGQVIKVREFSGISLLIGGSLIATGSPSSPIVFTTTRDDSLGGDAYNDGGSPVGAGQWNSIVLQPTSTGNVLDHVEVRYAGAVAGAIVVDVAPLTMTNSKVQSSANSGVRIQSSNPTLRNITFQGNSIAASMDLGSNPAISGVAMVNNGVNALLLDGGSLTAHGSWNDPDITYVMNGTVTVPADKTLSIAASQIIKVREFGGLSLVVNGSLTASGTAVAPIVFTTTRDDSVGGDAFNDGQTPTTQGQWNSIVFKAGSTANVLDHVEARFGGAANAAIFVEGGPLTLTNSKLLSSATNGIRIQNSNPTLTNLVFQSNATAASMDLASNPAISGVAIANNGINGLALDGGTLANNGVWDDADITYVLLNSITVPADKSLTIGAGQIVKVREFGGVSLLVDGVLTANGLSAAPITFTTTRDDSIGGDAFNDGDSPAYAGQWNSIYFRSGSTGNVLKHLEARYGGANVGTLVADGASVSVASSRVQLSGTSAVRVLNGGSATLTSNLLVRNADTGVLVDTGGNVSAINNTIDGNFRGIAADGATTTVTLTNNLITNNSRSGVFRANSATINATFNDVFNPTAAVGNYEGLTSQTGAAGNISADPKYFSRPNGEFRLRAGSPAIDSATSASAPLVDFSGRSRFDDPNVLNLGAGGQPFFDRGALERQEISIADVDLMAVAVSGPATGIQGQLATINWTVRNLGPAVAMGSWFDAVYLSADDVFTPDDIFLGEAEHVGDVGALASYSNTTQVRLPGVLPGNYRFIVRANSREGVFEALALVNNSAASAVPIAMDLPTLPLGAPTSGQLAQTGSALYYKLNTPAGADLSVNLAGPAGAANELYVSFGDLPTRQVFDRRGNRPNQAAQTISIANTQAGTYYVLVHAASLASAETITLTANLTGFGITGVSPARGSNTGRVTVAIQGAQFDAQSQPRLIDSAGGVVTPVQTFLTDSGLISATFDLTGRPVGPADVQVVNAGNVTTTLPDALNIVAGVAGQLSASLSVPSQVRLGRDFSAFIDYWNIGETDLVAPQLTLSGTGIDELALDPEFVTAANSLRLIAVSPRGPAGVLPPGASGRIEIFGRSIAAGLETFSLQAATYPTTPIDWASLEPSIRPTGISDAVWTPLFAQLQSLIGNQWSSYVSQVSRAATLLPPLEGRNYSLQDVFALVAADAEAALQPSVQGKLFLGDATQPLGNVSLQLFDTAQGMAVDAVARTDGSFIFPAVAPGNYELLFGDFVAPAPVVVTVSAGDRDLGNLVLSPGSEISGGVVIAGTGVPVKNIEISALSETNDFLTGLTDGAGRFVLHGARPGVYTLRAGGGAFTIEESQPITVVAGQPRRNINLTLNPASALNGRVLGPGGTPIAEAAVVAAGAATHGNSVFTGPDGRFRLEGLAAGAQSLVVRAAGFAPKRLDNVVLGAGGTLQLGDIALVAAGQVEGTVQAEGSAAPVAFAIVTLLDAANQPVATGQADSLGKFVVRDVPSGNYTLFASAEQRLDATLPVAVTSSQTTTQVVTMSAAGVITGRITGGQAQPLAGMTVTVSGSAGLQGVAVTDASGNFRIDNLPLDTYEISAGPGGVNAFARLTQTLTPAARTATADFSLTTAGRVSGRVLATDAFTPLENVSIVLLRDGEEIGRAFSDAAGQYNFIVFEAGLYQVTAGGGNRTFPIVSNLNVQGGAQLANVDLAAGNGTFQGVLTETGSSAPIAGAIVLVSRLGLGPEFAPPSATTGADGRFTISGLATGTYDIKLVDLVHATILEAFTVTAPALGPANVAPPTSYSAGPGTVLSGSVTEATFGRGLDQASVSVFRQSDGRLLGTAPTDAQGNYRFPGLAAGNYEVMVSASGRQQLLQNSVAASGTTATFNAALPPSTTSVSGTVSSDGGMLADATVQAFDATGRVRASVTSSSNGSYSFDTLPPGNYSVRATTPGFSASPLPILLAGNQTLTQNIRPNPWAIDTRSQPASNEPPVIEPGPGWLPPVQTVVVDLFDTAFPPGLPQCEPLRQIARQRSNILRNQAQATAEAQLAQTPTFLGIDADVGIVVTTRVKVLADIAALVVGVKQALGAFKAASDAAVNAASGVADTPEAIETIDKVAKFLAEKRPEMMSVVEKIYSGNLQNVIAAVRAGTAPDPGDVAAVADAASNLFAIAVDIGKEVGKLGKFAVKAPLLAAALGPINGLISLVLDWKAASDEYDAAEKGLEGRLDAVSHARYGEALARLGFRKAAAAYTNCNEKNTPPKPAPAPNNTTITTRTTNNRTSFDPNDKTSTAGFGVAGAIQSITLPYKIEFENDPNLGATIPAQEVFVTDLLDADLDLTTVEFTRFGFNNFEFSVPPGLSHYETTIDLRPEGIDLLVPVVMEVNQATRMLSVTFRSLDPLTGELPDEVDAGFLPVNNKLLHNGEGFFSYTVRPTAGLPTGTEILNQATIVFDVNEPILTPTTKHTLDIGSPASGMSALLAKENKTFTVNWSGNDDAGGSGIRHYTIYVSDNGAPASVWQSGTPATSADFTGTKGHTYEFFVVASDQVGNVEVLSATPDAKTTVSSNPWQNARNPLDVHVDLFIAPNDVLAIINDINAFRSRQLTTEPGPTDDYLDVNGDTFVSPADALDVINYINAFGAGAAEGEGGQEHAEDAFISSAESSLGTREATRRTDFAKDLISLLALDIASQGSLRRRRA